MPRHLVRLVVPDSHGEHIDLAARASFLADVKRLVPDEVIWLGDHVDCGGVFSVHQRSYTKELTEAYEDDIAAANSLLDAVQKLAPKARHWYILGNHEDHVERWASRSFSSHKDAELVLKHIGPIKLLRLRERGFTVIKSTETYNGLSVPGAMRRGKCHFTHGISASKHAADAHLRGFGASVVFGHCHRSMSVIERSVTSSGHGAWCPGTLAKLQPLYMHTRPSTWSHGYAVQFANAGTGTFLHMNVPIVSGKSLLMDAVDGIHSRRRVK